MSVALHRALHSDHRRAKRAKVRKALPYVLGGFLVMAFLSSACALYTVRNPEMSIAGQSVAQVAKECK